MKIVDFYSHQNGYEFIIYRKPELWAEIEGILRSVDVSRFPASNSHTGVEESAPLYRPASMHKAIVTQLIKNGWIRNRAPSDTSNIEDELSKTGGAGIVIPNRPTGGLRMKKSGPFDATDFVKDRISVEVQFRRYPFDSFDLIVKQFTSYLRYMIDVGIEILAMKSIQQHMPWYITSYEVQLDKLTRQGRGVPAVPMVIVGIAP